MMHGRHMLRAYSKTQSNIALSSGEAEYYAMVRAASESMGLKAMVADFKREVEPWLYVDATAVAQRVGLGKIRHLETQSLWLQQAVRNKRVGLAKVLGTMNPADAMTKALDSNTMNRLLDLMGLEKRDGRPEVAPTIEEDGDVNCVDVDKDGGTPSQSADKVVDERSGGSGLALRKTRLSKRRNILENDVLAGVFEHTMSKSPCFPVWELQQTPNLNKFDAHKTQLEEELHPADNMRAPVWDIESEAMLVSLMAQELEEFDSESDEPNDEPLSAEVRCELQGQEQYGQSKGRGKAEVCICRRKGFDEPGRCEGLGGYGERCYESGDAMPRGGQTAELNGSWGIFVYSAICTLGGAHAHPVCSTARHVRHERTVGQVEAACDRHCSDLDTTFRR